MTPEAIERVQKSWRSLEPFGYEAAAVFYDVLYELEPSLRPAFTGDPARQRKRLCQALGVAVAHLDRLSVIVPALEALGRRHAHCGVTEGHYHAVAVALRVMLARGLGPVFTREVEAAWASAFELLAGIAKRAYAEAAPAGPTLRCPEAPDPSPEAAHVGCPHVRAHAEARACIR